jgi:hypothetical protein
MTLPPRLGTPKTDISELTNQLGQAWGVSSGESLVQYLAWSEVSGLFSLFGRHECLSLDEICSNTILNESGADALICILASLKLLNLTSPGRYSLSNLCREYLLKESPYYVGAGLYLNCNKEVPRSYLQAYNHDFLRVPTRTSSWPGPVQVAVQHSRNFAPSVVAARTQEFSCVRHLVDIAGGSGVFAIPLALDHPDIRITLVELPGMLESIRQTLANYGVEGRIELVGLDIFSDQWKFDPCDGVLLGNVLHGQDDETSRFLCRKSFEILSGGGRIWLHEMLFSETRDGPLIAALWNANMAARKRGARQRTASELFNFLILAGFESCCTVPTAGNFSLVMAQKPCS